MVIANDVMIYNLKVMRCSKKKVPSTLVCKQCSRQELRPESGKQMVIFLLDATFWMYLIDRRPKLWIPFFKKTRN
jgi:hypothetical protein